MTSRTDSMPAEAPTVGRTRAGVVGWVGTLLSLVGIGVAAYLTDAHYDTKTVLACPDKGIINCEKVTTSSYSMVHGVPVAVAGLVFFVVMVVLQLPPLWRRGGTVVRLARLGWSAVGMLSVFWLLYAELLRLDAICLWCTSVHVLTFLLFVVTVFGTALAPAVESDGG